MYPLVPLLPHVKFDTADEAIEWGGEDKEDKWDGDADNHRDDDYVNVYCE